MFGPYSFINVIGGSEEKNEDGDGQKNMVEVVVILTILQKLYKGIHILTFPSHGCI